MRKWTYPYLEVLAEKVQKMNKIFRSPGRAEVQKAEFQIFSSQGRAEVRMRIFTSLEVTAEIKFEIYPIWKSCRTSAEDERDLRSPGRAEVWKVELQVFGSKDRAALLQTFKSPGRAEVRKLNFISLAVKAEQKSGCGTSYLLKSRQR